MDKNKIFSRALLFKDKDELKILQDSTILIAGVGGLGCVVSEILIRRGVGNLIIIDNKTIDEPDLNRQSLYTMNDIGRKKADVAKERLSSIHPYCNIVSLDNKISDDNESYQLINQYSFDGIVDCLDNFKARYILENFLKERNFIVHGGVKNDFGQITTITKGKSLKKLFGGISEDSAIIPVSAEIVFVISSLMANETINNILNKPQLLNKLLIVELADFSFFKIDIDLDVN